MGERKDIDKKERGRIHLSAPNLINICVDSSGDGELSGRIYHCWDGEPWEFSSVIQMLKQMEQLFDSILFPQASTQARSLTERRYIPEIKREKAAELEEVLRQTGERGSFITCVKFRQNADWQGEVVWKEKDITWSFQSTLEFLKRIDNALR